MKELFFRGSSFVSRRPLKPTSSTLSIFFKRIHRLLMNFGKSQFSVQILCPPRGQAKRKTYLWPLTSCFLNRPLFEVKGKLKTLFLMNVHVVSFTSTSTPQPTPELSVSQIRSCPFSMTTVTNSCVRSLAWKPPIARLESWLFSFSPQSEANFVVLFLLKYFIGLKNGLSPSV